MGQLVTIRLCHCSILLYIVTCLAPLLIVSTGISDVPCVATGTAETGAGSPCLVRHLLHEEHDVRAIAE
jgi:hypothetical protein